MADASLMVSLIFLSLLSFSSPLPSDTILDASEILSDSGYVSMALTLELISQTLTLKSPYLTIFAPPDSAFAKSGQPGLSLLQYHFCPLPLAPQSLKSLPAGTKIPTLSPAHMLVATNSPSDSQISMNDIKITGGSPIYDDGSLVIFGIQDFFDPNFQAGPQFSPNCRSSSSNSTIRFPGASWFQEASGTMRSNGYSAMASFLDSQLLGYNKDPNTMTVFAPSDQSIANRPKTTTQDPLIFLRHVVPCKLSWADLVNFSNGTVLPTYLDGFTITITRSGNTLMLNGVPVFYANMHYSDSLVVHGLKELLVAQEEAADSKSSSGTAGNKNEETMLDLEDNDF